jgi:hypothetical protein
MTRYCDVLQKRSTPVNSGYWNRLQQLMGSGDPGKWTCGHHANSLSAILKGMGVRKTVYCIAWWSDVPTPNSNHGALAVLHKGKAFVFDPWQLAVRRGGYVGADATMWNGMPSDKWEREMRKQRYWKFGTSLEKLKPTLTEALAPVLQNADKPLVISGKWRFYSGGRIGSEAENSAAYEGTMAMLIAGPCIALPFWVAGTSTTDGGLFGDFIAVTLGCWLVGLSGVAMFWWSVQYAVFQAEILADGVRIRRIGGTQKIAFARMTAIGGFRWRPPKWLRALAWTTMLFSRRAYLPAARTARGYGDAIEITLHDGGRQHLWVDRLINGGKLLKAAEAAGVRVDEHAKSLIDWEES